MSRTEHFRELCREKGLKVTPQRLAIFLALSSTNEHPSAETIHKEIRKMMPTVSLDTVYRTLTLLKDHGVISRVEVLDDCGRFDANLDVHHHFVCTQCKQVEDFYWPDFDRLKVPDEVGKLGLVQQPHAELRGICRACRTGAEGN